MGFAMFTESQTIIPAKFGISPGTCVTSIAVGAGGGGGSGGSADDYDDGEGTSTSYGGGGGGGAAGEIRIASFAFADVNQPVQVTVGLPGAGGVYSKTDIAAGDGKKGGDTFIGTYIHAAGGNGGKRGGDADGSTDGVPGAGGDGETPGGRAFRYYGGAGAGGYQLGVFKNVGKAGYVNGYGNNSIISPQGTGGGAGLGEVCPGGPFGGGDGGKGGGGGGGFGGGGGGGRGLDYPDEYPGEGNNGSAAGRGAAGGKDGYVYMGKPGSGLVLLFW